MEIKNKEHARGVFLEVIKCGFLIRVHSIIGDYGLPEYQIWGLSFGCVHWTQFKTVVSIEAVYEYLGALPWSAWKDSFMRYEPLDWRGDDWLRPVGTVFEGAKIIQFKKVKGRFVSELQLKIESGGYGS